MNYYKELYKILDDIFHNDIDTENMLQEEATNTFITSLLKKQRESCYKEYAKSTRYFDPSTTREDIIKNAPEPK